MNDNLTETFGQSCNSESTSKLNFSESKYELHSNVSSCSELKNQNSREFISHNTNTSNFSNTEVCSVSTNIIRFDHIESYDEREHLLKCNLVKKDSFKEKESASKIEEIIKNKDFEEELPKKSTSEKKLNKKIKLENSAIEKVNKPKNKQKKKTNYKNDLANSKKKKKSFCSCLSIEHLETKKKVENNILEKEIEKKEIEKKEISLTKNIKVEIPTKNSKPKVIGNKERVEQKTQLGVIKQPKKELTVNNKLISKAVTVTKSLDNIYKIFEYNNEVELPKFNEYMDLWFLSQKFASEEETASKEENPVETQKEGNSLSEIISSTLEWYEFYKFNNVNDLAKKLDTSVEKQEF